MQLDIVQKKRILIAVMGLIFMSTLYFLIVVYPRQGKIPVEVLVNPTNATIYIDNNKGSSGTTYLHKGLHTFKATANGWDMAEVTVNISSNTPSVALLQKPVSTEAKLQAQRDSLVREGLSGIAANTRGQDLRTTNPILNKLPYSDIAGPFKIDYGFQDDKRTPYLIVSYSTPDGRQSAIDWLAANKVDLATTEIIFEDFINPIQTEEYDD